MDVIVSELGRQAPAVRSADASPQTAGRQAPAARSADASPQTAGRQAPAARSADASPQTELRDEVDDLVAGWRAERPDLDLAPLGVLSRVSRLARHLDLARRTAFAAHGLEAWEFDVLSALRRQGPPYQLSPGALLRATLVTSGTMTNRIDKLAEAGLVSRHQDPLDRRGVIVQITDRGKLAVDAALTDLLGHERQLLSGLDAGQQDTLAALLRVLLTPFDHHAPSPTPAHTAS